MGEMQTTISRRSFLKLFANVVVPAALLPKSILRLGVGETPAPTQEEMDFLQGHEVSLGDQSRKVILMTYDDGGTPQNIKTILDAYKNAGGG
ncbi:MAG: hypothetical protein UV61_C0023G0002 [Candidatus Gottesmanbacteria bacterium GW2011_GWB1_43_11]|uniref:Polysaccharide deacetylase n=1 Tax=Candidatus Gottesmanbacteria bacterium GW2011_GWB1_43_11 TaxID=1618446 RepID=A0A0G1FDC8_9BACT|nr:MAG: hypothetical protein UV55_C0020G0002 [Candidatus Gottesmanbacteria bacterium GW2011_GWC1_43_10]KKS84868.1 MAG: hypothetical protein UV61_C0023G0002 [Candidatus Gottesmanbacteria bacterium GW2011_GWB1_43_11]OGG26311.1 MAG: hypothetical protein A3A59_06410 [Candidatus Gottesmanbacteria bacterium RIFCSPLOWO2_01_FULL_42_10]